MINLNKRITLLAACLMVCVSVSLPQALYAADILCPDLESEKNNTPGNVAGVQADIERLNLCVERAKLLSQLDDIAKQRQDTMNKISNPGASFTNSGGGLGGIPPLPLASLPQLPDNPGALKAGDVRIKNAAANPLDNMPTMVENWKVRKIWGQGNTMRAQLNDGNGTLLNVVKGDPLPDGRVIETVSARGVAVSQNGKVHDLSWDNIADSGSTLNHAAQTAP